MGSASAGTDFTTTFYLTLGDKTCDIYLNDTAYWRNIPSRVWEYAVGGYQVIKKWLSYREQEVLGHALTEETSP